jgi:large subunit ribosomal protein L24
MNAGGVDKACKSRGRITGKDKGKKGTVVHAYPKRRQVVVEGVHVVKRSLKPRGESSQGQIVEKSLPIDASNVALAAAEKKTKKKTK